jgi:hypothetical protein
MIAAQGNQTRVRTHTMIFLVLTNFAMKGEIYCFVNFMTTKYADESLPIMESLSSGMNSIPFVCDKKYCLARKNTFHPEWN